MRLPLSLLAVFLAGSFAIAQDLVAKTDAKTPAEELKCFKLPPGFEAQLVASEPEIQKPMQLAFDAKGRLWVTTSYHYPFAAPEGKGTDKLFVLSDFDAQGKAKKVQIFDDKLNIPIGVLPLLDCKSVIVSECGKILKLTDTDDDGKADKREVLFSGFGFKDTHGMTNSFTLLPDGWVYACHGFANDSIVKGKDGHEVKMHSGHTFRFRPDGSRIEIFTRGQVNPFGMCVDPWLNLYTADCHSKPMTQLVRGAYYDSFGKPHDGLGYAPHVINHLHGSTGLCGIVYYAADQFPKEWQDVIFVGNCVTNRINCDKIQWKGATTVGKELPDFLVSSDPWFRPVDIKLGPDGALYVSDFYNKIVGHYEVDLKHPGRDKDRGRVWRIVYKGKEKQPAPVDSLNINWKEASDTALFQHFAHPNITLRLTAANEAASRTSFSPSARDVLDDPANASARIGLMAMVLERTGEISTEQYQQVAGVAKGESSAVKPEMLTGLLVRSLISRTTWGEAERQLALDWFAQFDSIRVKRAVVDGMTAHPHADFVPSLVKFIPTIAADDVYLRHATKIALRNCLQQNGGTEGITADFNWTQSPDLLDAMLAIRTEAVAFRLVQGLKSMNDAQRLRVAAFIGQVLEPNKWGLVTRYANSMQDGDHLSNSGHALAILKALFAGGQRVAAKSFVDVSARSDIHGVVLDSLRGKSLNMQRLALQVIKAWAGQFGPKSLIRPDDVRTLVGQFMTKSQPDELRLAAIEAMVAVDAQAAKNAVQEVVADLKRPIAVRQQFAPTLFANPSVADCVVAKDAIKTAPYSFALTLAVGLAGDQFGADLLLNAVKSGEAPTRLLQEKAVRDRLKGTNVKDLDARVAALTKGLLPTDKRIEDLIKKRAEGFKKGPFDLAKGQAVFKQNCAICHQINNEGAKVGPQLDGVGVRGLERLLEDTLDPNRNVDAAFKLTTLILADGRSPAGLVREDGKTFLLIDGQGQESRILKTDVDKVVPSNLSAMPANVDVTIPEADYYHLLSYLLQQKPK